MKKETFKRLTPVNEARVIQVIEIKSLNGEGTIDDPMEEITEYYSLEGERLARRNMNTKLDEGVWNSDE